MFLPDLVVRGRRIVTRQGIHPGVIHVRNGRIIGVLDVDDVPAGCSVDNAGERCRTTLSNTHVRFRSGSAKIANSCGPLLRAA
jgi:hypothetical protein